MNTHEYTHANLELPFLFQQVLQLEKKEQQLAGAV
jgi:hypothetical protein